MSKKIIITIDYKENVFPDFSGDSEAALIFSILVNFLKKKLPAGEPLIIKDTFSTPLAIIETIEI